MRTIPVIFTAGPYCHERIFLAATAAPAAARSNPAAEIQSIPAVWSPVFAALPAPETPSAENRWI